MLPCGSVWLWVLVVGKSAWILDFALHTSASGTSFSDWIRSTCYADTLQVWFPAHWAPVVFQQLQQKEDNYRAENPSWMDQEEAPADILKQWREAGANRRMQFKVGKYRDGS